MVYSTANAMEQLSFLSQSLSVSDLTRYLRGLLESDEILQDVWVSGEISNLSRPVSGHVYFTLKDTSCALRCVVWKSNAFRLPLNLQNGQAVEAHGYVSLYERDGQYQLYVDALRSGGEGFLFQEFLRLKARLEAEGLFDNERKRPIPSRPAVIGIVTSSTGAALQDILNTLRARYPLVEVVIAPAAVQGDNAPDEIVAALGRLNQVEGVEVIIVARGGGSLEDLWAFNDEQVVRAIFNSKIPVVTGIGHETDFTLADFAADLRAPTPTGAAVLVTPEKGDLVLEVNGLLSRLDSSLSSLVSDKHLQLNQLQTRLSHASPERQVQNDRQRLDQLSILFQQAVRQKFQLQRYRLTGFTTRLTALSPLAVLERGYSIVTRPDGVVIRSVNQVEVQQEIQVRVADGRFVAQVETVMDGE